MCLYRDELYKPRNEDKGLVEVLIRKGGPNDRERTPWFEVAFLSDFSALASLA